MAGRLAGEATLQEGLDAFEHSNYGIAFPILKRKAEQGDPTAQDVLAYMYENGWGTPVDYTMAVYWYRKAATQGALPSITSLGRMYQGGTGVVRNYSYAAWLYRKAADQNYPGARDRLNLLLNAGVALAVPPEFAPASSPVVKTAAESARATKATMLTKQGQVAGSPSLVALIGRLKTQGIVLPLPPGAPVSVRPKR